MVSEWQKAMKGACTPGGPILSVGRLTTGLIAVAMAGYALLIAYQVTQRYPFPHNFHDDIDSPVLAIELAPDTEALEVVLGTDKPANVDRTTNPGIAAVACLRANTFEDFFFIFLYTLFLWQFASLFAITDGSSMLHRRTIAGLA